MANAKPSALNSTTALDKTVEANNAKAKANTADGFAMFQRPWLSCLIVLMLAAPVAVAQEEAIDTPLPTFDTPHVGPAYGAGYEHRQRQERARRDVPNTPVAVAPPPSNRFDKDDFAQQRNPGASAAGKSKSGKNGQGSGGGKK